MKPYLSIALLVAFGLSACVPSTPIVSDFNGDSVKIVQDDYFGEGARTDSTDVEAARICGKRGRKAEYASVRQLPNYQKEFLYLCL